MNREEVIRMAREAGFRTGELHMQDGSGSWTFVTPIGDGCIVELEKFAALVAAAERRKHQADIEHWKALAAQAEKWRGMAHARHCNGEKVVQEIQREAMELERDACAKVCDEMAQHWQDYKDTALLNGDVQLSNAASGEPRAANALAELIRARGNQ